MRVSLVPLAFIAAFVAVPAIGAEPPVGATVAPVTVSPAGKPPPADVKIDMQGGARDADELVAVWPDTAYHNGIDGHVRLRCLIDIHGLAERCEVASESPSRKGFGKAAMEMRPTFKLAPTMGPDGPVAATKVIAIRFKAPEAQIDLRELASAPGCSMCAPDLSYIMRGDRSGLAMRRVTMVDAPVWTRAASFDDLIAAYPGKPGAGEGYAVDHCQVRPDGTLQTCQTIKEEPAGRGFGKAALGLAAKFRLSPQVARTHHQGELWVDIPIRFPSAAELADRAVMAPSWTQVFDTGSVPKLFPPEAVAAGLSTGRGVARCVVGPDGALTACAPDAAQPDGLGFSEAAVKLASTMKMNLWSNDGAPVSGGVVRVPIRLNLRGGQTRP